VSGNQRMIFVHACMLLAILPRGQPQPPDLGSKYRLVTAKGFRQM
jgi:hypothetical protein